MSSGQREMADVMSFGAVVLGSSITWGLFSADYATYMKETPPKPSSSYTLTSVPLIPHLHNMSNFRRGDRLSFRDVVRRRSNDNHIDQHRFRRCRGRRGHTMVPTELARGICPD